MIHRVLPLAAIEGFIKNIYGNETPILHRPVFGGNEKQYLIDCIDSNFVSSVGAKVTEFEQAVQLYCGCRFAVATVNGTAALHVALILAEVTAGSEVITQAITFVATCNAIAYCSASPIFVDVDRHTLGMSPDSLRAFLTRFAFMRNGKPYNRHSGKRIAACLPMHTFGHPCRIDEIVAICHEYAIPVIEDSAESLGSSYKGRHTGTFGLLGTFSFNGNKIITTGGGGLIITDDPDLAARAKHLTTTAKIPHAYEFVHDAVGYNYRLPNLNAALGCAQMEQLPVFISTKRQLASCYAEFFAAFDISFVLEPPRATSNYWLNAIILDNQEQRDSFLHHTNANGIMTRPIWRMMSELEMFKNCQADGLANSRWLQERVVNIPSSVPAATFSR